MPAPTLVVGAPCWIDLYSSDTAKATEFYGQILGWEAQPPEEGFGGYFVFTKNGKVVAGCMANSGEEGQPDGWTTYLTTDDIGATVADAKENGAQVLVEPMDVADNGKMAMIADPGGAAVGIWEPGTQKGFEVRNEPGTAAWFELHTRDYDKVVDFYRTALRWDAHTASDTPEFRYTTLGQGEGQLAGIMDDSPYGGEEPAHWAVYFDVQDADATLEQIVALGGAIVTPAEDTPYGRLARATDPTGAQFRIVADNS